MLVGKKLCESLLICNKITQILDSTGTAIQTKASFHKKKASICKSDPEVKMILDSVVKELLNSHQPYFTSDKTFYQYFNLFQERPYFRR